MTRFGFSTLDIDSCRHVIAGLPLRHHKQSEASAPHGWGMHPAGQHDRSGIYSTCFAIQLLAKSKAPEAPEVVQAIVDGLGFLGSEFEAWKELDATKRPSRQRDKRNAQRYTDFDLALKNASIIDAANAVADIRSKHERYGAALEEMSDLLDSCASRLKAALREHRTGNTILTGWSWTVLAPAEPVPPDLIPTAYVVATLTHPNLRNSSRHFDRVDSVINTLVRMLDMENTVVHKAIAYNAIVAIAKQCDTDVPEVGESFSKALRLAADRIGEFPKQETYHFAEPLPEGRMMLLKPWIWLFPQLEIATAHLSMTSGYVASVEELAAELLTNTRENNGQVLFMKTQPMTLLANLRALQFLEAYKRRLSASRGSGVRFALVRFRLWMQKWAKKLSFLFPALVAAIIAQHLYPVVMSDPSVGKSLQVLSEAWLKFSSVWPLWLVAYLVTFLMTSGGWRKRAVIAMVGLSPVVTELVLSCIR